MSDADRKGPGGGRFRKGRSGNPNGRPKKTPGARPSPYDVIVDKVLTVMRNGEAREITSEEALQHRTYQDAIAGKAMAQRLVLKWIAKREAWYRKRDAKPAPPGAIFQMTHNSDNANEALQILGIATYDPIWAAGGDNPFDYTPLALEPWAVEAALARRRSAVPLSDNAVEDIQRCTRDARNLRWPKGARK